MTRSWEKTYSQVDKNARTADDRREGGFVLLAFLSSSLSFGISTLRPSILTFHASTTSAFVGKDEEDRSFKHDGQDVKVLEGKFDQHSVGSYTRNSLHI
jgi:hypothetical protein